jgi:hypothetical protein
MPGTRCMTSPTEFAVPKSKLAVNHDAAAHLIGSSAAGLLTQYAAGVVLQVLSWRRRSGMMDQAPTVRHKGQPQPLRPSLRAWASPVPTHRL